MCIMHGESTKLNRSDTKWRLFQLLSSVGTNQGSVNVSEVLLSSMTVKKKNNNMMLPSTFSTILIYIYSVYC